MSRKENSAKILRFIYLYDGDGLNSEKIVEASDLSREKVTQVLDDLESKGYVDFKKMMDGKYRFIELTGEGLQTAESEDKILESFSIGVNLGVVKADWNFNV